MKLAKKESFRSFTNLVPIMQNAIPDSKIVENMKLSKTKASYLVTEALGPFFYNKVVNQAASSNNQFVISFDETTNAKNLKEMQVSIRYFCNETGKVSISYLF